MLLIVCVTQYTIHSQSKPTPFLVFTASFYGAPESELSVYEYMGESALTTLIPRLLLDVLIADEKTKVHTFINHIYILVATS